MKTDVLRRLDLLEERSSPDEVCVWCTLVRPGPNGPEHIEPIGVSNGAGWCLMREPGEPVEAFRARAREAASVGACRNAVLVDLVAEEVACAT